MSETNILYDIIPEPVKTVPSIIFIVPYRDRQRHQEFFAKHMAVVLEDYAPEDYRIYYVEQADTRGFNRGAMKNIGFLAMKAAYPDDYKSITFVFNDVDTMPFTKNFLHYKTTKGVVKHFYGYKFALGGIVSMVGEDFETVGGYPNFWAWGYEDNLLQHRVLGANLAIDRSEFYPLMDENILQLKDGLTRIVNRTEFDKFTSMTTDGISTIRDLRYTIDETSGFIRVSHFLTATAETAEKNITYDLRNGGRPFEMPTPPQPVNRAFMPLVFEKPLTTVIPSMSSRKPSSMKLFM